MRLWRLLEIAVIVKNFKTRNSKRKHYKSFTTETLQYYKLLFLGRIIIDENLPAVSTLMLSLVISK